MRCDHEALKKSVVGHPFVIGHFAFPESATIQTNIPVGKMITHERLNRPTSLSWLVIVHKAAIGQQEFGSVAWHRTGIELARTEQGSHQPLNRESARHTDFHKNEDYEAFGLSGEVAAIALEAGLSFRYARVCTQTTIPYARELEEQMLRLAQAGGDPTQVVDQRAFPASTVNT